MDKKFTQPLLPVLPELEEKVNKILKEYGLSHLKVDVISFKLSECTPPDNCPSGVGRWGRDPHNPNKFICKCVH